MLVEKLKILLKQENIEKNSLYIIDQRIIEKFNFTNVDKIIIGDKTCSLGFVTLNNKKYLTFISLFYSEKNSSENLKIIYRSIKDCNFSDVVINYQGISLQNETGNFTVADHANLTGYNPLIGANADEYGTRFPDMSFAYQSNQKKQIVAGVNYPYTNDKNNFLTDNSFNLLSDGLIYDIIIANHCGLNCEAHIITL